MGSNANEDDVYDRNWRLYRLLDLDPPTTAKQVKWNFRKVTLRHHFFQAYLSLYNRSRKHIYDATGEEGYAFIASGAWGPLIPGLGAGGFSFLYFLVLFVEVLLLLLFIIFMALRVDTHIWWSWKHVSVPLLIFVIIMAVVALVALLANCCSPRARAESMPCVDRLCPFGNFVAATLYCVAVFWFVFSELKHDDPHEFGKLMKYFILLIVADVVFYLVSLVWRWPRRLKRQMEVEHNDPSPIIYGGIFLFGWLHLICCVAQWVVLALYLDGNIHCSLYAALAPFCVRCGLRVIEAILRSAMKCTVRVRSPLMVMFDGLSSFLANGLWLAALYFGAARVEEGKFALSMGNAMIPMYILLGYMLVGLVFTVMLMMHRITVSESEEARLNQQWSPRGGGSDDDDSEERSHLPMGGRKDDAWNGLDTTPSSDPYGSHSNDFDEYQSAHDDDDDDDDDDESRPPQNMEDFSDVDGSDEEPRQQRRGPYDDSDEEEDSRSDEEDTPTSHSEFDSDDDDDDEFSSDDRRTPESPGSDEEFVSRSSSYSYYSYEGSSGSDEEDDDDDDDHDDSPRSASNEEDSMVSMSTISSSEHGSPALKHHQHGRETSSPYR